MILDPRYTADRLVEAMERVGRIIAGVLQKDAPDAGGGIGSLRMG